MGWPPEKTYTRRPDCLEAVSRIRLVVSLMGSLRVAPDVVCFSTMLSGTNGLTSFALTSHGAIANAASSRLAINRIRDPSRLLLLQFQCSPWPRDAAMLRPFLGNYLHKLGNFGTARKRQSGMGLAMPKMARAPWWPWTWPVLALAVMIGVMIFGAAGAIAALAGGILIAAVFTAVYHAEVVAHRVGEPFGTLVLALAVTVIEVALIVSVMLGVSGDKAGLARDTVFAVVMIVCNGVVGLCLLSGGVRHHEQGFQLQGASAALAVLATL